MNIGSAAAARSQRSDLLDLIRTVAIVLVVFFHTSTRHSDSRAEMDAFEIFFARWGSKGVDIFFPLSGYLICRFLLTSQRPDFIRVFFLRRVFRILPLYLAAVTLAMVGMYVTGTQTYLLDRFWIVYSFLTAWFAHYQGAGSVPYNITWSLSVEEFSYIIFGLLALANRRLLPVCLLLLSIAPFFLKYHIVSQGQGFYYLPLARIDSIAIGGVAAWLLVTGRRPLLWLTLALGLCWGLAQTDLYLKQSLVLIQLALATGLVIVLCELWAEGWRHRLVSPIASIGFYSYFTYLFHLFIIEALYMGLEQTGLARPSFWVMASLALLLTHLSAMVSYRVFEGPMMRYGRGLEDSWRKDRALPERSA